VVTAISFLTAILAAEAMAVGAPHTELEGEPVVEATAAAEATQTATSPQSRAAATMPIAKSRKFRATDPEARMMASPPFLHGFAIYFSRRNSNHWGSPSMVRSKIQYSGSDATPSPSKTLVVIMTQSASTFPSCLDKALLTWLESLEKYSIDKWDQLKDQFTSNFVGAMGRSSTRMDLAMVKQEQGKTLRKYMRRFFDKRATVVDVTDKEVIDLFQDGLYHRRTFEEFGRRRPSSNTHLKDMITS
jgi:hypothetical protein